MSDLFIIILGLCIGSFLNVAIYRLPIGASVAWPPSACPQCGERLKAKDLVPVFSWLWLKGRCRYCQAMVTWRYPTVELLTGVVFLALWQLLGPGWQFVQGAVLASILIVITFTDLDHRIIPNKAVLFGFVCGLPLLWLAGTPDPLAAAVGVIAGALPLFLLAVLTNGMGGGDVKLAGMLGLYLGWSQVLLMLFLASVLGAIVGLTLMAAGKIKRKEPIPFGPFLAVAAMTVYIGGEPVIFWYLSLFS
jgi:leader peptidase (prepilin peptidase)/N-methyltransferase